MTRHFIVEYHTSALKPVFSHTFTDPDLALSSFDGALSGDGHSPDAVRRFLRTWTGVLMKGGDGYTVTAPDLRGSVTIRIATESRKSQAKG